MSCFVYLLRCSDNSLYCGQTNDIKRRVHEHNFDKNKSAKYLRAKKPVKLVYYEKFSTIQEALKREAEIKRLTKAEKEELVKENLLKPIL